MRLIVVLLVCLSISAYANERTGGGPQHFPNPTNNRGGYTIVNTLVGGLSASYGLAIQDNVPNSIWILNWSDLVNYEFDMTTGAPEGSWPITEGVDPDDQAYCEYSTGNRWFMTDYGTSMFAVFAENGSHVANIAGPSGYTNLFGIGAGHGHVYVGSKNESLLAWGPYTGTETSISGWTEIPYTSVYGLAVWGDYLFVACGVADEDNIFIHYINPDGSPNPTPVWSTNFSEEEMADGGIDYDGEYLYVYPQNSFLYVLDIDWDPQSLSPSTWANIKSSF